MSGADPTVPFGKYKGRPASEMLADADYMAWLEAQPWFRERFKTLAGKKKDDALARAPVHNKLQALFLEFGYCYAFANIAAPKEINDLRLRVADLIAKQRAQIKDWASARADGRLSEKEAEIIARDLAAFDACRATMKIARTFEVGGCDVGITVSHSGPMLSSPVGYKYYPGSTSVYQSDDVSSLVRLRVEIKPTVADEYPAVLRQMERNQSEYLFLESYCGEGATEAQFIAMFAASGKRVVFKRDVDAEAGK